MQAIRHMSVLQPPIAWLSLQCVLLLVLVLGQGCETLEDELKRADEGLGRSGKLGLLNWGLFECSYGGRTSAEDSPTGYNIDLQNLKFARQGSAVPAKTNITFGVLFYLPSAFTNASARMVYSFPPIQNPTTGRDLTNVVRNVRLGFKTGIYSMVYTFAEEYEVAVGKWTFQVFAGDKLLLQRKFTVSETKDRS